MLDEVTWDVLHSRHRVDRIIVESDGTRRYKHFVLRAYTHPEIASMLQAAGLEWERTYGDTEMAEFGPESRRMLVVARRQA